MAEALVWIKRESGDFGDGEKESVPLVKRRWDLLTIADYDPLIGSDDRFCDGK
ncbi:MAG: hypothetical protein KDN19_16745 [Verrucomicrobiae bacterium]|nr:hypothetical protein [Verrucomicrobiae bacterium]